MNIKRDDIKVIVCKSPCYVLPPHLSSCLAWLNQKLEEVPSKFRDSVKIEFSNEEDDLIYLKTYYYRPETDKEFAARKAAIKKRKLEEKAAERKEFERLSKKYASK
jgi:glucan phosphorylase